MTAQLKLPPPPPRPRTNLSSSSTATTNDNRLPPPSGARLKPMHLPDQTPAAAEMELDTISLIPIASLPPERPGGQWIMPSIHPQDLTVDEDEIDRLVSDTKGRKKRRFLMAVAFPVVIALVLVVVGGEDRADPAVLALQSAVDSGSSVHAAIKREEIQKAEVEKQIQQQLKLKAEKDKQADKKRRGLPGKKRKR